MGCDTQASSTCSVEEMAEFGMLRIYTMPAAVLRSTTLLSEQHLHVAARFSKTLTQLTIGAVQSVL